MNSIKKPLLNFWNDLVIRIKKIDFLSLFKYLFLFLVTFLFILPFYLMFVTSIKTPTEIMQDNALSLPKNGFHFIENYKEAFVGQFKFMPYFWNTFRVTFLSTLLGTFCSILTAYALSNIFHFRSKSVIILLLYLGLMTTSETLTIINYRIVSNLGWVDYGRGPQVIFGTDYALIIPYLINIVHVIHLLITFNNIPKELYYSAKIDGTSNWKYLWKILVPITKSSIIVTVIFRIVAAWNAYAWPELMGAKLLTNMARKTFDNEIGQNINIQMAVAFLINIPLILIFIFFRKYIVSGENKSGIKG
ncbi:carbohydrate ABC transporter permease [Candidatus Phytoplasma ziziphi]|uniref:Carbohydrate ABC transporter permease n=1 Tax=Ziziphus jujuba witches'-broom phytoplasma TaxID=135727 RepID=A0A660HMH8_ZIZJU|nr:carbohydrate ABC transporter permease [Candidatus Phytoplasma ziziphi]AYJ01225.1 carbohydrate ABC transporter permease [Candidatus Phytoplasma ziziphi]